jgi:hypothetical protein
MVSHLPSPTLTFWQDNYLSTSINCFSKHVVTLHINAKDDTSKLSLTRCSTYCHSRGTDMTVSMILVALTTLLNALTLKRFEGDDTTTTLIEMRACTQAELDKEPSYNLDRAARAVLPHFGLAMMR